VYLGIDVGVRAVKAVFVDEARAIVATWRRKASALLWLLEITGRLVRKIEPQPGSGLRQQFEVIINRCAWRPYRI